METRKFSKFEIATIKRTAQSVNPMVSKKAKLKEQIDALQAEYDQLNTMQEQYEASIKTMTGGYGTEDLVEKVVEATGAVDKNGNPNINAAIKADENKAKVAGLLKDQIIHSGNVTQMPSVVVNGEELVLNIGEDVNAASTRDA